MSAQSPKRSDNLRKHSSATDRKSVGRRIVGTTRPPHSLHHKRPEMKVRMRLSQASSLGISISGRSCIKVTCLRLRSRRASLACVSATSLWYWPAWVGLDMSESCAVSDSTPGGHETQHLQCVRCGHACSVHELKAKLTISQEGNGVVLRQARKQHTYHVTSNLKSNELCFGVGARIWYVASADKHLKAEY